MLIYRLWVFSWPYSFSVKISVVTILCFMKGVPKLNCSLLQNVHEGLWKKLSIRLAVVFCSVPIKVLQEEHQYHKLCSVRSMIFHCYTDTLCALLICLWATSQPLQHKQSSEIFVWSENLNRKNPLSLSAFSSGVLGIGQVSWWTLFVWDVLLWGTTWEMVFKNIPLL